MPISKRSLLLLTPFKIDGTALTPNAFWTQRKPALEGKQVFLMRARDNVEIKSQTYSIQDAHEAHHKKRRLEL
jgi:hypothetical protein